MTNHFSSHANRFNPRLLQGGVNGHGIVEPPGGLPIIGARPQAINGLELVGMMSQQMMNLPPVSGISEGIMKTITERGNPVSPEESYTLKLIDALSAYQLAVRDIAESEQARCKALADAAPTYIPTVFSEPPPEPPAPTAEDLLLP